jgi:hypothetical protein
MKAHLIALLSLSILCFWPLAPCQADSIVVFNEIHYHPPENEAALEWIEIHNLNAVDVDISGWSIPRGVDFVFPPGTVLRGGEYAVVAANPAALQTATGYAGALGPFDGRLENSGETLELRDNNFRLMDSVRYRDEDGWPVAADGSGHSLAKREPTLPSAEASSWVQSAEIGGTPGDRNFAAVQGGGPKLPQGLVSWWRFDEQGASAADAAGFNNGTLGSGATRVPGIIGAGALDFDNSTNAFVNVGAGPDESFSTTTGMAIEALIAPRWGGASGDYDEIFRKEDGTRRILFAFQNDANEAGRDVPIAPPEQPVLSFGLQVGGVYSELDMPLDGAEGRPTLAALTDGNPHHVAATYDSASGRKSIYVDGALAFSASLGAGKTIASGGIATAYIGNMSGRREPFTGVIDEVAFWNRALSAAEVAAHHQAFRDGRDYFAAVDGGGEEPGIWALAFNELSTAAGEEPWIEILNHGASPIRLESMALAARGLAAGGELVFGNETLAAGARLVKTRAQLGFDLVAGSKVFLFAPGRRSAIDAAELKDGVRGRYPEGTGDWLVPSSPTPGAANAFSLRDEVVFHEVMYRPRVIRNPPGGGRFAESPEAWVELYNRSDRAVDLTGWRIDGGIEYAFEPGLALGPGEYLVVAGDADFLRALHPGIRIAGDFTGRLSRQSDRMVLKDARGNPADELRYHDAAPWPAFADGLGATLELVDARADNSNPAAWAASDEGRKTAWRNYSYRETAAANIGPTQWREFVFGLLDAGEALIDDLRVIESPDGAAVEMVGNGDFENGSTGWRIIGNHRHSRIITDPENAANHVLHLRASGATEHMHNHAETTLLGGRATTNGRVYEVRFRARWLAGSNQLHTRLYFNRVPRTTLLDLPPTGGTPGAPNSTAVANLGPTLDGLAHAPVAPAAGEDVAVSVRAGDPDGISAVRLWWSVNAGAWQSAPMAAAGGGRYSGTIPGQAAAALVQFYVEAEDARGVIGFAPIAGRDSRALYRVADGQAQLQTLHNLRLLMTTADANFLHEPTNVMSNDRLGGTVVYDEREAHYDVGVRLKGSERGRNQAPRVGFNIDFPADRPFRGVHDGIAIDRSGGWAQGSTYGQDEILIKHMILHAGGIPGEYVDLIRLIAPRSAHTGVAMLQMARFGGLYLDSQWENGGEGTTFELELIYYPTTTAANGLKLPEPDNVLGADLANHGDNREIYRWNFLIGNHRDRDDYEGLIPFLKAMSLTGATLESRIPELMDVDEWMRAFAMMGLCGVGDTYTFGNNHNLRFFVHPDDGRVLALPWDWDFAFVQSTTGPLWGDQNLAKVTTRPPFQRLFYGHVLDIVDSTYNSAYMSRWVEHYGRLAGRSYTQFRDYIAARGNSARSRLPARVNFAITTNNGQAFTVDTASAVLTGSGWIDVRSVLAEGIEEALEVSWTSLSAWRTTVPLLPGVNEVALFAFDHEGELVGTDSIAITSTFQPAGPLFIRGDANLDRRLDVSDVVRVLRYLFAGGELGCADAADVNDDEALNIADAAALLEFLFRKGASPRAPYPAAGFDREGEALGCETGG